MVSRNFLVNAIQVGADHAQHDPIAWSRSLGAKPPDLSKRSMNEAPEETSLASRLMFVFMSFELDILFLLSSRWIGMWLRLYRGSAMFHLTFPSTITIAPPIGATTWTLPNGALGVVSPPSSRLATCTREEAVPMHSQPLRGEASRRRAEEQFKTTN
jgi:hypothetical protein